MSHLLQAAGTLAAPTAIVIYCAANKGKPLLATIASIGASAGLAGMLGGGIIDRPAAAPAVELVRTAAMPAANPAVCSDPIIPAPIRRCYPLPAAAPDLAVRSAALD